MFKRTNDQIGLFWARYVDAVIKATDSAPKFTLSGEEFGFVLCHKHNDPRAAAICLSPGLIVAPDGTKVAQPAPSMCTAWISSMLLAGIKHEISCLNSFGRVSDYPDNILNFTQEDWSRYRFIDDKYLAPLPAYVRALRLSELEIPDYSNVVDLQTSAALPLECAI